MRLHETPYDTRMATYLHQGEKPHKFVVDVLEVTGIFGLQGIVNVREIHEVAQGTGGGD